MVAKFFIGREGDYSGHQDGELELRRVAPDLLLEKVRQGYRASLTEAEDTVKWPFILNKVVEQLARFLDIGRGKTRVVTEKRTIDKVPDP